MHACVRVLPPAQGRTARIDKRHLPDQQLPDEGQPYRSPCVPGWLGVRVAEEEAWTPGYRCALAPPCALLLCNTARCCRRRGTGFPAHETCVAGLGVPPGARYQLRRTHANCPAWCTSALAPHCRPCPAACLPCSGRFQVAVYDVGGATSLRLAVPLFDTVEEAAKFYDRIAACYFVEAAGGSCMFNCWLGSC